ncbi:MAG: serine hydrolase domain-containing protein [Armatimonadaceae bacterium]
MLFLLVGLLSVIMASAQADPVDEIIQEEMKRQNIPGASVAILRKGKIVKAKGYGYADLENRVPATPQTVYQIGSVTKQFTAIAILMLAEAGKLKIDDPVVQYLPDAPPAWKPVTLRQMLTHTSGIVPNFPETQNEWRSPITPAQLLQSVHDTPLQFEPGSKWDYCNTAYFALGLVVEKVSGKSYAEFLTERIFKPLGMSETRLNDVNAIFAHRAAGYTQTENGLTNAEMVHPSWPFAAGALVSTVTDLARWDAALRGERLVKAETLQEAWKPVRLTDGSTAPYGFGWALDNRYRRMVHHGGGIPGFTSYILRFPDEDLTVILLCNQMVDTGMIARRIALRQLPAPKDARRITFRLNGHDKAQSVAVAGSFNEWTPTYMKRASGGWEVTVTVAPGRQPYKFIVDGEWITDPSNPETEKDGEFTNSVRIVSR